MTNLSIQCQSSTNLPITTFDQSIHPTTIQDQSADIAANIDPSTIQCQPRTNLSFHHCQSNATRPHPKPQKIGLSPIGSASPQIMPIESQSEDIPHSNGEQEYYGDRPKCLDGGRIGQRQPRNDPQSDANTRLLFQSSANSNPIRRSPVKLAIQSARG